MRVFGKLLSTIVLDNTCYMLPKAPTQFCDIPGTMPAAAALVHCIMPLVYG